MKKNDPLVSVLMPVFNAEMYIVDSINSILAQSYKNIELIILNDASTDQSGKIAQNFAKKHKNVHYFENTVNKDIAESRNILVSKARGVYIAWQDADDISLPDRLRLQVDYLEAHPKVGILGGWLQFFDESGGTSIRKYDSSDETLRKKIFRYSPVAQPTAMIRAVALKQAGLYGKDLSPAEDIDMSFRIGVNWEFGNLQSICLLYRRHDASASFSNVKKAEIITLKVRYSFLRNNRYHFTVGSLLYNTLQIATIWVPANLRFKIFEIMRNTR